MRLDPRLAAVPVVALVVAVTWVAAVVAPTPHGSAASLSSVIAVHEANLVCPQAGGAGTGPAAGGALASGATPPGAARIAFADAGATDSADSHLATQALGAGASAAPIAVHPDHAWVVDGPPALTPTQVSVNGSLTDTLSAVQFSRTMVGTVPQASAVQCDGPTTDAWFAGFSSNVGAHATLLLSNVDSVAGERQRIDLGRRGRRADSAPGHRRCSADAGRRCPRSDRPRVAGGGGPRHGDGRSRRPGPAC